MELRCPHCGKILNMSLKELAASGKMVVCPQCLGEFVAQNVDVTSIEAARKPMPVASVTSPSASTGQALFCHNCGNQLPARGLNYCPFCGSSLHLEQPATRNPQPAILEKNTPAVQEADPIASNALPAVQKPLAKTIQYMPELVSRDLKEEPASALTKFICSIIILVLLAIFIFIVYEGNK